MPRNDTWRGRDAHQGLAEGLGPWWVGWSGPGRLGGGGSRRRAGLAAVRRGPDRLAIVKLGPQVDKASGRSKLTREPKQIDAQLGKQTGAELSALFVKRYLVAPSGLYRPVWISRMTKPAEDRVAGEFNPAGRLTEPCDNFFN